MAPIRRHLRGQGSKVPRSLSAIPLAVCALVLMGLLLPWELVAQGSAPTQMRHFWHVFVAYAIAWVLLFGWVVSILKRLKRVEDRLSREG